MIDRLKELRKELGYNQVEFAKHFDMSQTAYSMIESGRRQLTDRLIKLICLTFKVNEEWLRNGTGEMFLNERCESEFMEQFSKLPPKIQKHVMVMIEDLLKIQEEEKEGENV